MRGHRAIRQVGQDMDAGQPEQVGDDSGVAMMRILEAEQQAEVRLQAADDAAERQVRGARGRARGLLAHADRRVQAIRQTHGQRLARSMSEIDRRREQASRQTPLGEAEMAVVARAARRMADELLGTSEDR